MPNSNNNSIQDKFITLENLEHYNDYVYPEEMTWDEYQEITPEYGKTYFIPDYDADQSIVADAIVYDNTGSDLHASNVQDAIDELADDKANKTDSNLQTTDKTIVGGINELKSGFTTLDTEVNGDATVYPYADVITIEDAVPSNLTDCSVKIEPVQDLHGQSAPYVGGAGKNKLPLVLTDIKAANTDGTWNDNVYTINNSTITVNTDNGGNITSIKANGTFSADTSFKIGVFTALADVSYTYNGCPQNGSDSTYLLYVENRPTTYFDYGNGATWLIGIDTEMSTAIFVKSGYNAQNLMFYPMVCLSSETDKTFVPYTNICPISGHTEASVQRDGKNIANPLLAQIYDRYIILGGTTGSYLPDGTVVLEAGTYTASCNTTAEAISVRNNNETVIEIGSNTNNITFTLNGTTPIRLAFVFANEATRATTFQLEKGSTATPYEPYQGKKTYTIALGDTIYGGTVDFDSGVMTVTHKFAHFTDLTRSNNTLFYHILNDPCVKNSIDIICDREKSAAQWGSVGVYSDGYGAFMLKTATEYSSASDCLAAYGGEFNICYPLATPFTVQLTPQQIQLLKGTNTITASTGDISVTVNGVSGSIGAVQEQVNGLAEDVANKLDAPVLIASSSATGTYANKFNEIKSAINNLTNEKKRNCYLIVGNNKYYINNIIWNIFSNIAFDNTNSCISINSIEIGQSGSVYKKSQIKTDSTTITDALSTTDSNIVYLYA